MNLLALRTECSLAIGHFLSRLLMLLSALLLGTNSVVAQEPSVRLDMKGQIAERPFAIGYAKSISPERTLKYLCNLTEQLSVGKTILEQSSRELQQQDEMEWMAPKVTDPLQGVAMYMVSGLIPAYETISFQQVIDEDDAQRLVNGRRAQWGEKGSMEDLDNGCFRVQYRSTSSFQLPENVDESADTNKSPVQHRGYCDSQKVVVKDGKKFVEHEQLITSLFRYHDSMLYESNFEERFEVNLPSAEAIRAVVDGSTDMGFQTYLDRVPLEVRQLAWNVLGAAAGSQVQ